MNRRKMLGGVGAAGAALTAVGVAAQAGPVHPDAELIAACERHPALLRAWNKELSGTYDKAIWRGQGPAGVAYEASRTLIAAAEPQTMEGLLAKARAARSEGRLENGKDSAMDFTSDASAWAWDVMNDLLRLVGSAA